MGRDIVQNRIDNYKENSDRVAAGKFNHVPFYGFNKLQKFIPGVVPGLMYKITSHTGVGKTKFAKYLFVYQTLLYALQYKLDFKIIYYALEESEEEFLDDMFIHLAKRLEKVTLNRFALMGMTDVALSKKELDAIENVKKVMQMLVVNLIIVDDKYTPSDMYKSCRYHAKKWGKFELDREGKETDNYTPNNPNQIRLVVADHISLIGAEFEKESNKFLSPGQSIAKWHTSYGKRVITKKWNWAVLNIQQQSLESEKQQFTSKGDSIVSKILPGLDGLANNREVSRDDYVVMGLFAPSRYDIDNYRGYDINKDTPEAFGDNFRSLHLLKNRFGHPNKILPMFFDGSYTYFKEMPLPDDPLISAFHALIPK